MGQSAKSVFVAGLLLLGLVNTAEGGLICAAVAGGVTLVAAPVVVPAALGAIGFGSAGVAAGSTAAGAMSLLGTTGWLGGIVATAQSVGAAGLGASGITAAGATVSALCALL